MLPALRAQAIAAEICGDALAAWSPRVSTCTLCSTTCPDATRAHAPCPSMSALPAPRGSSARRAPVKVHQTSQDPLGEVEVPTGVDRSIDSVQLFLRDIGRTPLLTAAQETVLAKRIEQG